MKIYVKIDFLKQINEIFEKASEEEKCSQIEMVIKEHWVKQRYSILDILDIFTKKSQITKEGYYLEIENGELTSVIYYEDLKFSDHYLKESMYIDKGIYEYLENRVKSTQPFGLFEKNDSLASAIYNIINKEGGKGEIESCIKDSRYQEELEKLKKDEFDLILFLQKFLKVDISQDMRKEFLNALIEKGCDENHSKKYLLGLEKISEFYKEAGGQCGM